MQNTNSILGAMAGMTGVDFKLHEYCESSFGDFFRNLPTEVVGPASEFADDFEVIKRGFDGEALDKISRLRLLPLKRQLELAGRSDPNYDFVEGKVMISGYCTSGLQPIKETDARAVPRFVRCSSP